MQNLQFGLIYLQLAHFDLWQTEWNVLFVNEAAKSILCDGSLGSDTTTSLSCQLRFLHCTLAAFVLYIPVLFFNQKINGGCLDAGSIESYSSCGF